MTIEQSDAAPEKWKHSVRSQESDIWVCFYDCQESAICCGTDLKLCPLGGIAMVMTS